MAKRAASWRVVRSFGALLAGAGVTIVPAVATDWTLQSLGFFPPLNEPDRFTMSQLLLALAYRVLYGMGGGYVAARLAPDYPLEHALGLGALGLLACLAGAVTTWGLGPAWYPIALVLAALPCAWVGGRIRLAERS